MEKIRQSKVESGDCGQCSLLYRLAKRPNPVPTNIINFLRQSTPGSILTHVSTPLPSPLRYLLGHRSENPFRSAFLELGQYHSSAGRRCIILGQYPFFAFQRKKVDLVPQLLMGYSNLISTFLELIFALNLVRFVHILVIFNVQNADATIFL